MCFLNKILIVESQYESVLRDISAIALLFYARRHVLDLMSYTFLKKICREITAYLLLLLFPLVEH